MVTKTKNTYSFDSFLSQREQLNDFDNPFLVELSKRYCDQDWATFNQEMKAFSAKVSGRWRSISNEMARVENHPRLRHYDAHNHRIDQIVRTSDQEMMEKEIFSEALFSSQISQGEHAIKRYLIHTNGEAGVACPMACTDGLVALLEKFQDTLSPPLQKVLQHSKEGIDGEFALGAQFMSEIQGGSNIPANVLEAIPEKEHYKLYGNKFFCSVPQADYSVVTARVQGTDHVGVFIVPTWLEGDKEKERRNGHEVNRLKWKLGTCELPSSEINYQGAIAYPIGPLEKGTALAVGIVLTRSRIDIGFATAAHMMRAAREASLYARFREVFGRKIDEFPMAKAQIDTLVNAAKRSTATAFKIYQDYHHVEETANVSEQKRFDVRELILLQKVFSSKEAVDSLRTAISIFGGHGAIEDFSSIPRIFRDAMVNELWEGPRNVLLAQVYRDLKQNAYWYPPEDFVASLLNGYDDKTIHSYGTRLKKLMKTNLYDTPNEENIVAARQWEQVLGDIFYLYQQQELKSYPDFAILPQEVYDTFL
ncbi:acyl-CoA dehydrogenase family protein [Salinibacillus xinjiangensis]|uniref:acyl-CoA dehydrogenase family protein n=1 Tax=Salinibacillus xinjiangensis TaxID=1229268 RepID=UPI001E508217|nr:acyl-CoA dehydrogenase family protein [Salinibacillus xinjiangensis]